MVAICVALEAKYQQLCIFFSWILITLDHLGLYPSDNYFSPRASGRFIQVVEAKRFGGMF